VNLQCITSAIVNEPQFPKPVHKQIDPRASCAHHLCQSLLTDLGSRNFGLAVLAEVGQQEQNASKSLLTGIEKLVNQILFVSDAPRQQICHEQIGKRMFLVEYFHHGLLIDAHHRAIGHCGCGAPADGLPRKATFSKEIALIQNPYCGFLPARRHDGEFHPFFLNIENGIRRVALSKDRLLFGVKPDF
jgi:hypothetical protein